MNHFDIIEILTENGHDAFLVGGAVRDKIFGSDVVDYDISTSATPEEVMCIFCDLGKVKFVGESFGVVLVNDYEVATFRTDFHNGVGDKNCSVKYAKTIHEDLSRRDLTINAMAICPNGEIIDVHGGVDDLNKSIIRFVGNANKRINEDPNRIIRACRFLAKIEGRFAKDTRTALIKNVHLIKSHVAVERIRMEIMKAMKIKNASLFFSALADIGALKYVFPEMEKSVNHFHGKHHPETVWEHMMLAGDSISTRFPLLKFTLYIHDIGKPQSWLNVIEHSKGTDTGFNGHDVTGAEIISREMEALRFTNEEIAFVSGLIRLHMNYTRDLSAKAKRKIVKKLHDAGIDWKSYILHHIADRHANLSRVTTSEVIHAMVSTFVFNNEPELPMSTHDLAISGGDLIKEFDLVPGPIIGRVHRRLLDFVIEFGECYNERDHLLILANHYIRSYDGA